MKIVKEKTVAFVGSGKTAIFEDVSDRNLKNVLQTELLYVVEELYKEGKDTFLSGLRNEFEMAVAEAVLEYKQSDAKARLYIVSAPGQEGRYPAEELLRYRQILEKANGNVAVSKDADAEWNDFLIKYSSEMIVYGEEPEVRPVLEQAEGKGVETWNMYEELEGYFCIQSPVKVFLQNYPKVRSFRYGREGVIFRGYNQPFPVEFVNIARVDRRKDRLYFVLKDGMVIVASLLSEECFVRLPPLTDDGMKGMC